MALYALVTERGAGRLQAVNNAHFTPRDNGTVRGYVAILSFYSHKTTRTANHTRLFGVLIRQRLSPIVKECHRSVTVTIVDQHKYSSRPGAFVPVGHKTRGMGMMADGGVWSVQGWNIWVLD